MVQQLSLGSCTLTGLLMVATLIVTNGALQTPANKLEEQIKQLNHLMDRRPIIRLNPDRFKRFVGSDSIPRNYSFIVMMTALSPQRGCHICRQAQEEFLITASSYRDSQLTSLNRLYFGSVDYDDGSDIFNSLNINSAPCILYFSERGNFKKPDELNIQRLGFGADILARWIAEKTGNNIKIIRPLNLFVPIVAGIFGLILAIILYMSRHSLSILFNRNLWGFSAVALVLLMTSGQMWNHIRGAPAVQRSRTGQISYIHESSNGQYVIETYIVMAINAGIAVGMVLMTDGLRSGAGADLSRKRVVARVGFFMLVVFFSLLLSVFRQKSYGYPYRLLF